jgi:hypothetical protein
MTVSTRIRSGFVLILVVATAACGRGSDESNVTSNTPAADQKIVAASSCENLGEQAEADGYLLECTATDNGSFWIAKGPVGQDPNSDNGSGSDSSSLLGTSCDAKSELTWTVIGVVVCDGGKYRFAVPEDFPPTPSGGYTSRPDWYPTLNQILGAGRPEPTCAASTVKFTHPVVPLDQLATTIPYGAMIGDHITPIDHAYLGIKSLEKPKTQRTEDDYIDVTAPADGIITELSSLGAPWTNRVTIDHGCGIYTLYMVLNRPSGVLADAYEEMTAKGGYLPLSVPVKAGEVFGQQRDNALDFNVFDGSQWLSGFASPVSYLTDDTWKPYTADYLPFFSGEIRTVMESSLQRTSAPRVGKIDHDVIGAAAGNWFLDGTFGYGGKSVDLYRNATTPIPGGPVEGKNANSWSHLSISPHEVDTEQWVFSIGWFTDPKGDFPQMLLGIPAGKPAPSQLTSVVGPVVYDLYQLGYTYKRPSGSEASAPVGYKLQRGQSKGRVVLHVNADGTLSLEVGTEFTSAKRTYRR